MRNYILNSDHSISPCADPIEFAKWYENIENRIIARGKVDNDEASTVFLGIDHNFEMKGAPLLFETMIFPVSENDYQTRCSTYEEALEMHNEAIRYLVFDKGKNR